MEVAMRVIRFIGVMLVAGLLWVVISVLLKNIGFGNGAVAVTGCGILFILGPLLAGLASGSKPNPTDSATSSDSTSTNEENV
jgi:hypothetical protein